MCGLSKCLPCHLVKCTISRACFRTNNKKKGRSGDRAIKRVAKAWSNAGVSSVNLTSREKRGCGGGRETWNVHQWLMRARSVDALHYSNRTTNCVKHTATPCITIIYTICPKHWLFLKFHVKNYAVLELPPHENENHSQHSWLVALMVPGLYLKFCTGRWISGQSKVLFEWKCSTEPQRCENA